MSDSEEIDVLKGMFLAQPSEFDDVNDEVWCVTKVIRRAKDAKVTLLRHTGDIEIEATATFPDGKVRTPFRLILPLTPKPRPAFVAQPGMRASVCVQVDTVIVESRGGSMPRKIIKVTDYSVVTEPEDGNGRQTSIKRENLSRYTIVQTPDGRRLNGQP